MPPPNSVVSNGWAIAGRFPGGSPLPRRRETGVQFTAGHGCEGPPPSRSLPIIVARNGWAIAGRSPGGRPLRRRRETGVEFGGGPGRERAEVLLVAVSLKKNAIGGACP